MSEQISTVEELDALPEGSVLLKFGDFEATNTPGIAWQKDHWGRWHSMDGARSSAWLVDLAPFTVLWPLPDAPAPSDDEREAARRALTGALVNAGNYPPKVTPHILGQDMAPLIDKAADAILAAGFRRAR